MPRNTRATATRNRSWNPNGDRKRLYLASVKYTPQGGDPQTRLTVVSATLKRTAESQLRADIEARAPGAEVVSVKVWPVSAELLREVRVTDAYAWVDTSFDASRVPVPPVEDVQGAIE